MLNSWQQFESFKNVNKLRDATGIYQAPPGTGKKFTLVVTGEGYLKCGAHSVVLEVLNEGCDDM